MGNIMEKLELTAQSMYCKKVEELTPSELHLSLGKAVMGEIAPNWEASKAKHNKSMYLKTLTMLLSVTAVSEDLPLAILTVPQLRKFRLTATESVTSTVFSNSLSRTAIRLKFQTTGRDLKIRGVCAEKTKLFWFHSKTRL